MRVTFSLLGSGLVAVAVACSSFSGDGQPESDAGTDAGAGDGDRTDGSVVPTDGSPVAETAIGQVKNTFPVEAVAGSGSDFFYSNSHDGFLYRVGVNTLSSPEPLPVTGATGAALAVDQTYLFWSDDGTNHGIFQIPRDGTGAKTELAVGSIDPSASLRTLTAQSLSNDTLLVYGVETRDGGVGSQVRYLRTSGGTWTVLATVDAGIIDIASDESGIAWAEKAQTGRVVFSAFIAANMPGAPTELTTAEKDIRSVGVGKGFTAWSTATPSRVRMRVSNGAKPADELFSSDPKVEQVRSLAVAATKVYWVTSIGNVYVYDTVARELSLLAHGNPPDLDDKKRVLAVNDAYLCVLEGNGDSSTLSFYKR